MVISYIVTYKRWDDFEIGAPQRYTEARRQLGTKCEVKPCCTLPEALAEKLRARGIVCGWTPTKLEWFSGGELRETKVMDDPRNDR